MIKKLLAESQKQHKTVIMGVVNTTPDSFSDGGQYHLRDQAVKHAQQLIKDGANILDIGGESTRPNAKPVSVQEELDRVIPVVELLKAEGLTVESSLNLSLSPCVGTNSETDNTKINSAKINHTETDILISVDTSKPEVMAAAINAKADMINDVTGMENPESRQIVAKANIPVCIMHMLGDPRSMQENPSYSHVVDDVANYLQRMADICEADGIAKDNLILDPGIGFGKSLEHNLTLLAATKEIHEMGYPLLIGVSRKSFIDHLLSRKVDERLAGSLGAGLYAAAQGADILRVHDVRETVDALRMFEAIISRQ